MLCCPNSHLDVNMLKALAAAALILLPAAATAQEIVWTLDNEFTEDVAVEFYSIDRDHVWPGGEEIWVLSPTDGAVSYPLQCQAGETICFGAWTISAQDQWGVGMDMGQDCEFCCAQCGTVLDVIELN